MMDQLPIVLVCGLKATPLFLLAWLASLLLRRRTASLRHLIWTLAVGGALLMPAAIPLVPRVDVPVLPMRATIETPGTVEAAEMAARATRRSTLDSRPSSSSTEIASGAVSPSDVIRVGTSAAATSRAKSSAVSSRLPALGSRLIALLFLGTLLSLVATAASLLGSALLERRTRPATDGPLLVAVEDIRRRLGVRRPIRLLLGDARTMPMTWGLLRPALLLPATALSWPAERLRAVLLHEVAHAHRGDWATQLVARLACALYWWHPLAWVAARRMREEREHACDDLVLAHGTRASDYAQELLELARGYRAVPAAAFTGIAMARPSQLSDRLLAVLDTARIRRPVRPVVAGGTTLVAALLLVPLAGLRPIAREAAAPTPSAAADGPVVLDAQDPVSALPALTDSVVVTTAEPTQQSGMLCLWNREVRANERGNHSTSTNIDGARTNIRITEDDCTLRIDVQGRYTISDDDRNVTSLSSGGYFRIEEERGSESRRVYLTGRSGTPERTWIVNGRDVAWNAEATAWFSEALLATFRHSGLDAEARAKRIFARSGADGLWREIPYLHSGSALTSAYTVLLDRSDVDGRQARRIASDASTRIRSSGDLAHVLSSVLRKPGLDDATRADVVRAGENIRSSGELAGMLVGSLERGGVSSGYADAVLATASGIRSSGERSRVLVAVTDQLPTDSALPMSYVTAARGINSSGELAEALVRGIRRSGGSPERQLAFLTVATEIRSNGELSRVLQVSVQTRRLDNTTRAAFFEAASQVVSSGERANILSAVVARTQPSDTATVREVLRSAQGIPSSGERARVLVQVASGGMLTTDALLARYRNVAEGIGSRGERERALRAAGIGGN